MVMRMMVKSADELNGRKDCKARSIYSSAVVSGKPYIKLKFCTAAPRRALDQVVEATDRDHPAAHHADRDVAKIRVDRVLRAGQMIDDADERLVGVKLAQRCQHLLFASPCRSAGNRRSSECRGPSAPDAA